MARLPRYALPGQPQHVMQRGNNRSALFIQSADYARFRAVLRTACDRHGCAIHAYVFMTNHVHLLMTPTSPTGISRAMQSVGCRYVKFFNRRYERTGTLWEGRYRATAIDSDRYLFACYRYIERNPVRAGMVGDPEDYLWSSYRANALGVRDPLVTIHDEYRELGSDDVSRRRAYRALCSTDIDKPTLNAIRRATGGGWALGGRRFRDDVSRRAGRRAGPLPQGRRRNRAAEMESDPNFANFAEMESDPNSV
jgi:putative transposase